MSSKIANGLTRRFVLPLCVLCCGTAVAAYSTSKVTVKSDTRAALTLSGVKPSATAVMIASPLPIVAGDLLISEFRLRGPNGSDDEFIEIYNPSLSAHTVLASTGSGYAIAASDTAVRCTIPNGTVIPSHGHFLCTNSIGYGYGSYPAGDGTTATADATYTTDIPDNVGIALFSTDVPADFSSLTVIDAAGPTNEANTLYKEGTGYGTLTPFSIDSAWVRDNCGKQGNSAIDGPCGSGGLPIDTNNNVSDFYFADTNGTQAGGGQRLAAPGPENLSAPTIKSGIIARVIDSSVAPQFPPNRVRDMTSNPGNNSTFGTIDIRRRFINTTGVNVTRLRFRVIDITTFPAIPTNADLRPIFSPDVVVSGINDADTCGLSPTPCAITVHGTVLETGGGGGQPNGGGWNSSLSANSITLGTPLAPNDSVNVRFLMGIEQKGSFHFVVTVEALP